MAAMPELVATPSSPPSSAASRFSNTDTVGLEKREYVLPSRSPENVAAACSADSKTKLDVA